MENLIADLHPPASSEWILGSRFLRGISFPRGSSSAPRAEPLQYLPQGRTERLIATGRAVLAVFSLVAIWLDPSEPAKYANIAYALLAAYAIYALLLGLLVWHLDAPPGGLPLFTHACDLAIFPLFMYFTEGPTSPFFVYFVFSMLCGTLRWQVRGTLWTAAVALATFIGLGVCAADLLRDPDFELSRFIIRGAYLAVVAALLGYLGAYEGRRRREMSRLANWPQNVPLEARAMAREVLGYAAAVLGAPQAFMAWEEPEEPWLYLASWCRGEFRWTREPPGTFQPLVAEPLAGTDFLCLDVGAPVPTVLHTSSAGLKRWQGLPVHRDLQARFATDTLLSLCLRGEGMRGRLFFLGKPGMGSDDLVLGEIVARQVASRIVQLSLVQQQRESAALEERVRLAHDLHDGVIQSLFGAALQLQTVYGLLEDGNLPAAQQRLKEIQLLLADEQRDLRLFFHELQPGPLGCPEEDSSLTARLGKLLERVEKVWGVRVELRTNGAPARVPGSLAYEVSRIVREAVVNAAKHAQGSTVRVELGVQNGHLTIAVADNGRGFSFQGHYDQTALNQLKLGPVCLKERIASLGGSLAIDSTGAGARLDIRLPLEQSGGSNGH